MTMTGADLTVRKTLDVDCSREHAFAVFTDGIDSWWPFETHSIGGSNAVSAKFKERELVEVLADGSECHWADVVEFDPPSRILLEWKVNPDAAAATDVEVTFTELDGKTRVELVHSGFERLGEGGAVSAGNYDSGWDAVLGRFVDAIG
jgi:uncharacterized protein YndB with AHSA1/START domain